MATVADENRSQRPPPPEPAPETKLDGTPVEVEDDGSDTDVLPGTKLGSVIEDGHGRWEVGVTLRAGGMGTVYRGQDRRLNNGVAIKLLRAGEGSPEVRRFRREARELGALSHPNIVRVLDYGYQGGIAFMVMDFLDGEDLDDRFTAGRSYTLETAPELYRIAGLIGHALIAAHARGVVHRDIKPANIFLRFDGAELVPVLVDFGIVGMHGDRLKSAQTRQMTLVGAVIGTPGYMSREQLNRQQVGPQTDLYSLAVVVYQGLTGFLPFDRSMGAINNPYTLLEAIKNAMDEQGELEVWIRKLPSWVPAEIKAILTKALDPDAEKRGTMEEFVEVMKRHGKVNASPRTPTPPQKPGTVDLNAPTGELILPSKRPKWLLLAVGGLVLSLVMLLVIQLSAPPRVRSSHDAGASAARPQPTTLTTSSDAGTIRDSGLTVVVAVVADASVELSDDVPPPAIEDASSERVSQRHSRRHARDNRRNQPPTATPADQEAARLRAQLTEMCCTGRGGDQVAEQLRTDPDHPVRHLEHCQAPEPPCEERGDRRPWCRLCGHH